MKMNRKIHWRKGEIYPVWPIFVMVALIAAVTVAIWMMKYYGTI